MVFADNITVFRAGGRASRPRQNTDINMAGGQTVTLSDAVTVDESGPKIKPELMEPERIYHCVYQNRVLLFFVDDQKFLSCYEIDEPDLVEKVRQSGDGIEDILKEYAASAGSAESSSE